MLSILVTRVLTSTLTILEYYGIIWIPKVFTPWGDHLILFWLYNAKSVPFNDPTGNIYVFQTLLLLWKCWNAARFASMESISNCNNRQVYCLHIDLFCEWCLQFSDLWYFPPSWWSMLELWHREIWRWWKWTFLSNSSLEIEGAEKSYFQWFIYKAGIRCIGDIKDQNGDFFLSCIDIILKYMVRCNFIDFHVIIRAMPTAWKTKPRV